MGVIAASTTVTLACATKERTQCKETSTVPAYVDPKNKVAKPLQTYPYICLSCWLAGWRDGAEGSIFNVKEKP